MIPFSLDERSHAESYIHLMLLNQLDEFHYIISSFKIKLQIQNILPH